MNGARSSDSIGAAGEHLFLLVPAQHYVGQFLSTFKEFPPRQNAGSFSLDAVLESLQSGTQGGSK